MTGRLRTHMDCEPDRCLLGDPSPCRLFTDPDPASASKPLTAIEALAECGLSRGRAGALLHDLALVGWTVRPRVLRMVDHSEIPEAGACACGDVWPCPRGYPECSWHPGEHHGICSESAR